MSTKVILGIHGLANKPPRKQLKTWWRAALAEGLQKNCGNAASPPLEMSYWADLLYRHPLHDDRNFERDGLYNDEPYVEAEADALRTYRDGWLDRGRAALQDVGGDVADAMKRHFGMDAVSDWLIARFVKDLDFYYDANRRIDARKPPRGSGEQEPARKVLQDELRAELRRHAGREVMLIAHSMGSIIAYDVLRDIGRSSDPADRGVTVSHLVTIGSPLGLPPVKAKIVAERTYDRTRHRALRVRTPSIVTTSWYNFADRRDPVAFDTHLKDDFHPNADGVRVVDDLVENDYCAPLAPGQKKRKGNPHKSYGYLRTPELSAHVAAFLG